MLCLRPIVAGRTVPMLLNGTYFVAAPDDTGYFRRSGNIPWASLV